MAAGQWTFELVSENGRQITCEATLPASAGGAPACNDPEVELRLHAALPADGSPGQFDFGFSPKRVQVIARHEGVLVSESTIAPDYELEFAPEASPECAGDLCASERLPF